MITLILFLGFITFMLYMGFKLTGALLSAIIWIAVLVPVSIVLFALGTCMLRKYYPDSSRY